MKLEQFYLIGHSFGSYISAHYALAHQKRIVKLILMSVPGVPQALRDDQQNKDYGKFMKSYFEPPSFIGKIMDYGFKKNFDVLAEHF